MQPRHKAREIGWLSAFDSGQVGSQSRPALVVKPCTVHPQCIEITHFLPDASLWIAGSKRCDDVFNLLAAVLGQLVKCAKTSVLRVERMGFHPAATSIKIKVFTRTHGGVKVAAVYTFVDVSGIQCQ